MKSKDLQNKRIPQPGKWLLFVFLFLIPVWVFGQQTDSKPTQLIRGVVKDAASGEAIPYATVSLSDMAGIGAISDGNGNFRIDNVPLGR